MKAAAVIALLLVCSCPAGAPAGELFDAETLSFLKQVDGERLGRIGVQYKGRIGVLDTLARDLVGQAFGKNRPDGVQPAPAMLELYFNAGGYLDKPVIYVREKNMRKFLSEHLGDEDKEQFRKTHRLPPAMLVSVKGLFDLLQAGRAETPQCVSAADASMLGHAIRALARRPGFRVPVERLNRRLSSFLAPASWRPLPSPRGQTWVYSQELLTFGFGGDMGHTDELFRQFAAAFQARRAGDEKESAKLAGLLDRLLRAMDRANRIRLTAPASGDERDKEFAALAGRFLSLRTAWRGRDAGKVNKLIAELDDGIADAAGQGYPSPAVRSLELLYNRTYQGTVIWIGFAVALVLTIIAAAAPDRRAWRQAGMTALCLCTAALLAGFVARWVLSARAWYLPPIMNQFEAVIGSALLAALLAIVLELALKKNYFALAAALYATVSLLCGFFLPEKIGAAIKAQRGILASPVMAVHVSVIIIGHALVGMTFVISTVYVIVVAYRGLGGGGERPSSAADLTGTARGTLAEIDRCNLIVAQIACWTVALGTILGAYWADFAWARWWGWDRKETWALITTLVYVVILHARFVTPPRWRGVVTACGCILGCGVMMFNWIIVNYYLAGIHSYA